MEKKCLRCKQSLPLESFRDGFNVCSFCEKSAQAIRRRAKKAAATADDSLKKQILALEQNILWVQSGNVSVDDLCIEIRKKYSMKPNEKEIT